MTIEARMFSMTSRKTPVEPSDGTCLPQSILNRELRAASRQPLAVLP